MHNISVPYWLLAGIRYWIMVLDNTCNWIFNCACSFALFLHVDYLCHHLTLKVNLKNINKFKNNVRCNLYLSAITSKIYHVKYMCIPSLWFAKDICLLCYMRYHAAAPFLLSRSQSEIFWESRRSRVSGHTGCCWHLHLQHLQVHRIQKNLRLQSRPNSVHCIKTFSKCCSRGQNSGTLFTYLLHLLNWPRTRLVIISSFDKLHYWMQYFCVMEQTATLQWMISTSFL